MTDAELTALQELQGVNPEAAIEVSRHIRSFSETDGIIHHHYHFYLYYHYYYHYYRRRRTRMPPASDCKQLAVVPALDHALCSLALVHVRLP